MPDGIVLVAYAAGKATKALIDGVIDLDWPPLHLFRMKSTAAEWIAHRARVFDSFCSCGLGPVIWP